MAKRLGVWEIRKYAAAGWCPEQNISHWCYCFIWLINYVQTVALIKWMHSNQALPPLLHPQLLDALSSVQQNFETQLKTRNRRYNDQCPVHNLSVSNFVERRWKLVPSIHLNADAVVARGILGSSYFWLSMYWSSLVSIECCRYLHYWGCCHSRMRPLCSMRDRSGILLIYVDEGNINIINMEIFLLRLSARYFLGFLFSSFLHRVVKAAL